MHAGPQRRWRSFTLELLVFFPGCALPSGTPGSRGRGAPRQNQRPQDRNKMKAVERTVRETSNMFSLFFSTKEPAKRNVWAAPQSAYIHTPFLYPTYRIKRGGLALCDFLSPVPSLSSHSEKQTPARRLQMVAVVCV